LKRMRTLNEMDGAEATAWLPEGSASEPPYSANRQATGIELYAI
jgi:hypothetical protein